MEELGLRDPRAIRALVQALRPLLFFYFRAEVRGLGRLPRGPAILVANHGGGMGPGDFIFVPPYVPHPEINASDDEPLSCVLVRSDQDPVVVNLDIEPTEKPAAVHWIGPNHPNPIE